MNTNEQQWQECPLEEATHARAATGKVYKLDADKEILLVSSVFLDPDNFEDLGITPVRKAEVCPVEFAGQVGGTSFDGHYTEFLIRVKGNVGGNLGEDLLGRTLRFTEVQP